MEVQLVLGTGSANQTHLTFADVVSGVLNFGDNYVMMDIVWLHVAPISFYPKSKIKSWIKNEWAITVLRNKY